MYVGCLFIILNEISTCLLSRTASIPPQLRRLKSLKTLILNNNPLRDAQLRQLASMEVLEVLHLRNTQRNLQNFPFLTDSVEGRLCLLSGPGWWHFCITHDFASCVSLCMRVVSFFSNVLACLHRDYQYHRYSRFCYSALQIISQII